MSIQGRGGGKILDSRELLVRRLHTGLGVVLFSVVSFAATDLLAGRMGQVLHAIQLMQILAVTTAFVLLRRPGIQRHPEVLAQGMLAVIYLTTAGAAVVTGDVITMQLLFIVMAMGTAAFLPWSGRAQTGSIVVAGLAAFVTLGLQEEGFLAAAGYPTIAMVVAFVASAFASRESERSRRQLEEKNKALAAAQRLAHLGSWEWDIQADHVTWSEELYRIFGLVPGEFQATYQAFVDRVHPEDQERTRRQVERTFATGEALSFDHRIELPDATVRTLHAEGCLITDEEGRPLRMVGTAQDVTGERQAEAELARARDAALEATALKSAFLANMSHEIRTPLNVIVGYNEFIAEALAEKGDSSLIEYQQRMQGACQRLLDTIHGILDFSKMEAGAFDVRPQQIDLPALLEKITSECRPLAITRGLRLQVEIEDRSSVYFDEYCLSSALSNLVQNAIKFTPKGEVVVRADRTADGILRLTVRDTGIGIDPTFRGRLFEPFSQQDSGYTRQFEGSGLGLALTRRYLEANGATIEVDSEVGVGSTFRISFARTNGEMPSTRRNEIGTRRGRRISPDVDLDHREACEKPSKETHPSRHSGQGQPIEGVSSPQSQRP